MPRRYNRMQRVGDLIQIELAAIIQRDTQNLNIGMVTITSVEVAPDLSNARVFVSVLEDDKAKETIAELNNASKHFRYDLAHAVKLRITPQLKFIYDDSTMRGSRISSLIDGALKQSTSDDNKK